MMDFQDLLSRARDKDRQRYIEIAKKKSNEDLVRIVASPYSDICAHDAAKKVLEQRGVKNITL